MSGRPRAATLAIVALAVTLPAHAAADSGVAYCSIDTLSSTQVPHDKRKLGITCKRTKGTIKITAQPIAPEGKRTTRFLRLTNGKARISYRALRVKKRGSTKFKIYNRERELLIEQTLYIGYDQRWS